MKTHGTKGAATQVYSKRFDQRFFDLPIAMRERVQQRIDQVGSDLLGFAHYRMTGEDAFRLRIGDYRVIYDFDAVKNELFLIALGHRRDIYKQAHN